MTDVLLDKWAAALQGGGPLVSNAEVDVLTRAAELKALPEYKTFWAAAYTRLNPRRKDASDKFVLFVRRTPDEQNVENHECQHQLTEAA